MQLFLTGTALAYLSLGQSMRILKREVQGLHEDETAAIAAGAPVAQAGVSAEAPRSQQPG